MSITFPLYHFQTQNLQSRAPSTQTTHSHHPYPPAPYYDPANVTNIRAVLFQSWQLLSNMEWGIFCTESVQWYAHHHERNAKSGYQLDAAHLYTPLNLILINFIILRNNLKIWRTVKSLNKKILKITSNFLYSFPSKHTHSPPPLPYRSSNRLSHTSAVKTTQAPHNWRA